MGDMPRRGESSKSPTETELLAMREEMLRLFPCKSWECDDDAPDGSVEFRCQCGQRSGSYPSYEAGAAALGEHLDEVDAAREKHFTDWVHARVPDAMTFFHYSEPERRRSDTIADRVRRRPGPEPAWRDDFPRVGGPHRWPEDAGPQYGLALLLRHRMSMVGVVSTPILELAERLGLRLESSFGGSHDCEIAYVEHESDAFALTRWAPTQDVEISAYIPRGEDGLGLAQLERFLMFAGLTWDDVIFPRTGGRTPTRIIES